MTRPLIGIVVALLLAFSAEAKAATEAQGTVGPALEAAGFKYVENGIAGGPQA